MALTKESVKRLTGASDSVAQIWLPYFNKYLPKYGINTNERIVAFLSQLGHESGGLLYTEEIASGDAYDTRTDLGNTPVVDGDGRKYKGRGLIQITGKSNYQGFKDAFGIDVIKNPTLLGGKLSTNSTPEQLKNSLLASIWFWNRAKLNTLADKFDLSKPINETNNLDTITRITKVINGGTNGLSDRINKFESGRGYVESTSKSLVSKKGNILPIALISLSLIGFGATLFILYKKGKI
jgi:putative chitinase